MPWYVRTWWAEASKTWLSGKGSSDIFFMFLRGGSDIFFMYLRGGSTLFYIYINRWNVAKQHTHFSIMLWSNISTLFIKCWPGPCVELSNYYQTSVGHCFFIGYRPMGKGRVASRWMIELFLPLSVMCAKGGGQPFFLTLKGGGQAFFSTDSGGGQSFFSHFWDLPQWWNHLSAARSLTSIFNVDLHWLT